MPSRRLVISTNKSSRKRRTGTDFGPRERWQHSGRTFQVTDDKGCVAARATEEHILDILGLKKLLSVLQIEAGLRLKADYHAAAIARRVTGSYSGAPSARDYFRAERERTDAEEAAYQRWRNAVKEMGLRYSEAVVSTVCYDEAPPPCDIPALQGGLEKLATWYGMKEVTGSRNLRAM
ncbi:MAG: DUF6456 domain-containing protein [Alphaproteobacteria bacterium]|nr:DUF6456 domain-containing protein [Alphaproteobacteria bacterium]